MSDISPVCALLPLKAPAAGKSRLSSVLSSIERQQLSLAMFEDVLDALLESELIDAVAVLTTDPTITKLATARGCSVYQEDMSLPYEQRLAGVAKELENQGFGTLLYVAGDLPCLKMSDIEELLNDYSGGVTVCVATADDGTNGLVCSPPTAITPEFGAPSRERHLRTAYKKGLTARSIEIAGFALDVDRLPDLINAAKSKATGPRTRSVLRGLHLDLDAFPDFCAALTGKSLTSCGIDG